MTSVITSDHRLVTASISLKWPIRKSRSKQIDWTYLITPDIRSAFVTDVRQEIDSRSDFRLAVLQVSVRHLSFKRNSSYSRLQDGPQILIARKTVLRKCSRYGEASTEHRVSLINQDEVHAKCAEEFAKKRFMTWKNILWDANRQKLGNNQYFLWQKIQIYELCECRVDL